MCSSYKRLMHTDENVEPTTNRTMPNNTPVTVGNARVASEIKSSSFSVTWSLLSRNTYLVRSFINVFPHMGRSFFACFDIVNSCSLLPRTTFGLERGTGTGTRNTT